jgi:hypothetical protein
MRYILSARVRPERRRELLEVIEAGRFSEGFPYGDLGETLCRGRVDESGTIRWVEVCYCREFLGVAMDEEIGYFEEYLTDITIADARSPHSCEGYPVCTTAIAPTRSDSRASRFSTTSAGSPSCPMRPDHPWMNTIPRGGWAGAERSSRRRPGATATMSGRLVAKCWGSSPWLRPRQTIVSVSNGFLVTLSRLLTMNQLAWCDWVPSLTVLAT